MPLFNYIAIDEEGKQKEGTLEADSQNEAISRIKEMGCSPTQVAEIKDTPAPAPVAFGKTFKWGISLLIIVMECVFVIPAIIREQAQNERSREQNERRLEQNARRQWEAHNPSTPWSQRSDPAGLEFDPKNWSHLKMQWAIRDTFPMPRTGGGAKGALARALSGVKPRRYSAAATWTKMEMARIRKFDLHSKVITDLTPLAKLKGLRVLDLNDNQITDVRALTELKQLRFLYLHNNQLTDVSALAELKQLKRLYLAYNKLTDISSLAGITKLEVLYLTNNPDLSKAEIDKLQKALPKCLIIHNATK